MTQRDRKIRVMHLASNPEWAGAEVHLATLADSLKCNGGVDVSVCVLHDGKLVEYLKERGIDVRVVRLKWLFDVSAVFKIKKIMEENRIDLVHTHGYKANVIGSIASALRRGTKCVRTEHGLTEPFRGFDRIKMGFYEYLDSLTGRHMVNKVISVSKDIQEKITDKYRNINIETVHNGISDVDFAGVSEDKIRRSFGIGAKSLVVGVVGRLVPVKGHSHFLEAAKIILKKRRDVLFILVGDGPLRESLEASVPEEFQKNIKFTGFRSDVKDIMRIMDIVAFSSLSEGIPYALLEAMSMEKAIVATNVGGLAEVISDGSDGLLVRSGDAVDIADKCFYLLQDAEKRKEIGKAASVKIRNNFSVANMTSETLRIYQEVLED